MVLVLDTRDSCITERAEAKLKKSSRYTPITGGMVEVVDTLGRRSTLAVADTWDTKRRGLRVLTGAELESERVTLGGESGTPDAGWKPPAPDKAPGRL
jgi:hypothetical protein